MAPYFQWVSGNNLQTMGERLIWILSDAIEERLTNAEKELKFAESFNFIVLNDKFGDTLKELSSIIFDENHEYNRDYNLNILDNLLDK